MHFEHADALLEGHGFHAPGVRADGHDADFDEILGAGLAEARFGRNVALQILLGAVSAVEQVEPAGMEQDDIALAQLDALLLGGAHNVFRV